MVFQPKSMSSFSSYTLVFFIPAGPFQPAYKAYVRQRYAELEGRCAILRAHFCVWPQCLNIPSVSFLSFFFIEKQFSSLFLFRPLSPSFLFLSAPKNVVIAQIGREWAVISSDQKRREEEEMERAANQSKSRVKRTR